MWKAAAAEDTDVSGGSGGPASEVEQKSREGKIPECSGKKQLSASLAY